MCPRFDGGFDREPLELVLTLAQPMCSRLPAGRPQRGMSARRNSKGLRLRVATAFPNHSANTWLSSFNAERSGTIATNVFGRITHVSCSLSPLSTITGEELRGAAGIGCSVRTSIV